MVAKEAAKLHAANSVLVIGNGSLTVRFVAELSRRYPAPKKKITVLHHTARLLSNSLPEASQVAEMTLKMRGVELVSTVTIKSTVEQDDGTFKVVSLDGSEYVADRIYLLDSITANTEFMREHFADMLSVTGRLQVDESLRLLDSSSIFVLSSAGQIGNSPVPPPESAFSHASLVATNLLRAEKKKKLLPLSPEEEMVYMGRQEVVKFSESRGKYMLTDDVSNVLRVRTVISLQFVDLFSEPIRLL